MGENQPTLTLKLELWKPTHAKRQMYTRMTELNTRFANWLLGQRNIEKQTSKAFKQFSKEKFPSAVACQTVRTVKSQQRYQHARGFRNLWCEFNNQNFKIEKSGDLYTASFPTQEKRIGVPIVVTEYQKMWLNKLLAKQVKQGSAKLVQIRGKWYILLSLSVPVVPTSKKEGNNKCTKVMGVDLGLRYLAVAAMGTKALFFRGNHTAFIRRRYAGLRRGLGKVKKLDAIRKLGNKEARWMRDHNHKISRRIVNFAKANGVGLIRMEDLSGIRFRERPGRPDRGRSLHSWAFRQLQTMIEYKAQLAGIRVEYVNPKDTSMTCKCGHRDKRNRDGIRFCCTKCGYRCHADLNAAINIAKAVGGVSDRRSGHRGVPRRTTVA